MFELQVKNWFLFIHLGPGLVKSARFFTHSNINQDIYLKFLAFVHHKFVHIWPKILAFAQSVCQPWLILAKNFDASSNNIWWDVLKRKEIVAILDPLEPPLERIFQYLSKNGALQFFERAVSPPSRCPRISLSLHYVP